MREMRLGGLLGDGTIEEETWSGDRNGGMIVRSGGLIVQGRGGRCSRMLGEIGSCGVEGLPRMVVCCLCILTLLLYAFQFVINIFPSL